MTAKTRNRKRMKVANVATETGYWCWRRRGCNWHISYLKAGDGPLGPNCRGRGYELIGPYRGRLEASCDLLKRERRVAVNV
jgi:hypothetical protein